MRSTSNSSRKIHSNCGRVIIPEPCRLFSHNPTRSIYNYSSSDNSESVLKSVVMPTGSSGQEPGYSSFDPNVLADGRRSNELPVKSQYAGDNKKLKDAVRDPKPDKQSEKKNSTGEKSASLILKYTLGIGHANTHRLSVQCCSRAPPKESRLASVLLFKQTEQSFDMKTYLSFTLWHSSLVS
jgi:hypothetical protein